MSLADLVRREAAVQVGRIGVARHAIVSAVDPVNHACKVTVQPEGVESGWIPDPGFAAGSLRISSPCEIGTQVLVTPAEGDAEHPVITGRIFDAEVLPAVSPVTGQPAQPGEFLIAAGQAPAPESNGQAAQTAAFFHVQPSALTFGVGTTMWSLTSGMAVLTVGGTAYTFTPAGLMTTGNVTANGIDLEHHLHTGVQSGTSMTGLPES